MTKDEFLDKHYEMSVQAGMNQRYHQRYSTFFRRLDTAVKIVTAAAAVIGAILGAASMSETASELVVWSGFIVSVVTTISAVALNVVPFGNHERDHRDFFRQWTDIREDLDALLFDCGDTPSDHVVRELKKLDGKIHRICGQEPKPDDKLIDECFRAEIRSREPAKAA
jgi:hypothetical protein